MARRADSPEERPFEPPPADWLKDWAGTDYEKQYHKRYGDDAPPLATPLTNVPPAVTEDAMRFARYTTNLLLGLFLFFIFIMVLIGILKLAVWML
jgi:hypothetical protein